VEGTHHRAEADEKENFRGGSVFRVSFSPETHNFFSSSKKQRAKRKFKSKKKKRQKKLVYLIVIRENPNCTILPLDSRNQESEQIPGFWNPMVKWCSCASTYKFWLAQVG
jgi:hypothetical protein